VYCSIVQINLFLYYLQPLDHRLLAVHLDLAEVFQADQEVSIAASLAELWFMFYNTIALRS
jgi:hypothetical protein